MVTDPDTGLPALPDDHRWRIEKTGDASCGIQFYNFFIEKKAPPSFWASLFPPLKTERWVTVFSDRKSFFWKKDNINQFAKYSADEVYRDYQGVHDITLDTIVGTYPPKRLDSHTDKE